MRPKGPQQEDLSSSLHSMPPTNQLLIRSSVLLRVLPYPTVARQFGLGKLPIHLFFADKIRARDIRCVRLVSQPTVLFSHTKSAPATSQLAVLFSHNKSAPAISYSQANRAIVEVPLEYSRLKALTDTLTDFDLINWAPATIPFSSPEYNSGFGVKLKKKLYWCVRACLVHENFWNWLL